MSFLGLRTIGPEENGFDRWSFSHAQHHNDLVQGLSQSITILGDTQNGSRLILNVTSTAGILPNMLVQGLGVPLGATVTGIDEIALNIAISVPATVTATGTTLVLGYGQLTSYILDPVNLQDSRQFLQDHQLAHNAINGALGTAGNDLQDVDWNDEEQLRAWLDLNWTEHQTWQQVTAIT